MPLQSPTAQQLPALVVGIETPIGLTIIRDLGRHGVAVHGIGRGSDAIGNASRYLHQYHERPATEEALIDLITTLCARLGGACIFVVSETDIALLNRHRHRMDQAICLFADATRMDAVVNKDRTYKLASELGMTVPRTLRIATLSDLEETKAKPLRFPVVLKWDNPNEAVRLLRGTGLSMFKVRYCNSQEELTQQLAPYTAIGIFPLIQEYCTGEGLGQFILMRNGTPHCIFQHRRVHEWPPEGGFSSMCESVGVGENVELMAQSVALLRALDWQGIAMVEYRFDQASGRAWLMEINGRFWGSLPLAHHAGVPFAWLAYQLFVLGRPVTQTPYTTGMRCRFMVPETKRLARILFRQDLIDDQSLDFKPARELFGYVVEFFRAGSRYYVFEWRDPKPFFSDLAQIVRTVARGVMGRLFKRS